MRTRVSNTSGGPTNNNLLLPAAPALTLAPPLLPRESSPWPKGPTPSAPCALTLAPPFLPRAPVLHGTGRNGDGVWRQAGRVLRVVQQRGVAQVVGAAHGNEQGKQMTGWLQRCWSGTCRLWRDPSMRTKRRATDT